MGQLRDNIQEDLKGIFGGCFAGKLTIDELNKKLTQIQKNYFDNYSKINTFVAQTLYEVDFL